MSQIIIYNQSPYFYYISIHVYKLLKQQLFDKIILINCIDHVFKQDNIYILFSPPSIGLPTNFFGANSYIVYNFEQFTVNKIWPETYINFLKNALFVIDYSIYNIIKFHDMKINSYFLPYVTTLSTGISNTQTSNAIIKDIDILFIGSLNKKRKRWIDKLLKLPFNIKIATNIFFEKSIECFARSKILLNIHYYDGKTILEVVRICSALENNCIVLSEKSDDEYYNMLYEPLLEIVDINTMEKRIKDILENYNVELQKNEKKIKNNLMLSSSSNLNDMTEFVKFMKNIIN
jgi:hypothetical protein